MRSTLQALVVALVLACTARAAERPNIIFILADDLGYGDLGCYGQQLIKTPALDEMASEGLRFTQFYAGSTVCAPSRAVLMTGKNTGHVSVRGNAGGKNLSDPIAMRPQTLSKQEPTLAELLKKAGYSTGLIGKWGLGELGSGSEPTKRGFDYFYGYINQAHAHNYYPAYLIRNETKVPLKNEVPGDGPFGQGYATKKEEYSGDLFYKEALDFVEKNKNQPFFLYLALTTPHANNEAGRALGDGQEVPDYGPYANEKWSNSDKGQAAMITRMDYQIGRLVALLKNLGIDRKTLIMFSSDNGPHREGKNTPQFFNANGGLRGMKRDLYEGGIRVPFIARWPDRIKPGQSSEHVAYFGDLMSTLADLTGQELPEMPDSLSFLPTLTSAADPQTKRDFLYWEFHENGSKQAVLYDGRWKGIRLYPGASLDIYDLQNDPGETTDLRKLRPDITAKMEEYLKTARVENPDWPLRDPKPAGQNGGGKNKQQ